MAQNEYVFDRALTQIRKIDGEALDWLLAAKYKSSYTTKNIHGR